MADFMEIEDTTTTAEPEIQEDDNQYLEFSYDGDSLSFKVDNDEESNILVTQDDLTKAMTEDNPPEQDVTQGPPGIPGTNGSSIIDCKLDRDGNLIVTLPEYSKDTSTILSVGGVLTKQQWLDMQNNIIRLNNALATLDPDGTGHIGKVDLATKTSAGIVQIGDGIDVTDGLISVNSEEVVDDVISDPDATNNMLDEVFNS